MTGVKQYVLEHVTRDGACGYGVEETNSARGIQDLIDLMKTPKGVEHCMKYRWPSLEVMSEYKIELQENGIYIDGSHHLANPRMVIAFGGDVNISVDNYNVCEIYATNGAEIKVTAKENAFVSVELHHGAKLYSEVWGNARVKEFRR